MPHKANARNCERICGFSTILGGYVTMTATLAGDQWNEGDVSCSVVRRVALPGRLLRDRRARSRPSSRCSSQMEAFPAAIAAENERNLPFLATTTILMEAVKRGAGRETAHEAIKEHSLAAVKAMRYGHRGRRPPGPPGGRPAHRPRQEGPPGDPRRERPVRRLRAQPGRRLRRRGEAAREEGQGRGGIPSLAAPVGRLRPVRNFAIAHPRGMRFLGPSLSPNPLSLFTWLNS